jgi:hypothetical protein
MNLVTATQMPLAEFGIPSDESEADLLSPAELQMISSGQATLNNI